MQSQRVRTMGAVSKKKTRVAHSSVSARQGGRWVSARAHTCNSSRGLKVQTKKADKKRETTNVTRQTRARETLPVTTTRQARRGRGGRITGAVAVRDLREGGGRREGEAHAREWWSAATRSVVAAAAAAAPSALFDIETAEPEREQKRRTNSQRRRALADWWLLGLGGGEGGESARDGECHRSDHLSVCVRSCEGVRTLPHTNDCSPPPSPPGPEPLAGTHGSARFTAACVSAGSRVCLRVHDLRGDAATVRA